jgi:hypothetical protein
MILLNAHHYHFYFILFHATILIFQDFIIQIFFLIPILILILILHHYHPQVSPHNFSFSLA